MEPIIGTVAIIEQPDVVTPPGPPHTYFGIAQNLMSGIRVLAVASPPQALTLSFVAAHVLECLLKAYLSRDGTDAKLKNQEVRHDLAALWKTAFAQGLPIPESLPSWADCLGTLHKKPYYLRYSTSVHCMILPSAEPMTSELAALTEVVREELRLGAIYNHAHYQKQSKQ